MKLFRIIVVTTVFVIILSQTAFTLKYAHGFEVSGSSRVPFKVQRDVNLRDAQPVRVRIVAVEEAYEEKQHRVGNTQCYYEKRVVETTDNRGFLTKLINPSRGGPVYENQYNCYNQPTTATMRVEVGYIVTYQRFGRHYQKFMYNRPYGKYITIMSNQG
jgi:hypothetical protein